MESVVVREGGDQRRISGQRNGRQPRAIHVLPERTDELGGHVLTIGRAAAVAAQENLPTSSEGFGHELRRPRNVFRARFEHASFRLDAPEEVLTNLSPCGVTIHITLLSR